MLNRKLSSHFDLGDNKELRATTLLSFETQGSRLAKLDQRDEVYNGRISIDAMVSPDFVVNLALPWGQIVGQIMSQIVGQVK